MYSLLNSLPILVLFQYWRTNLAVCTFSKIQKSIPFVIYQINNDKGRKYNRKFIYLQPYIYNIIFKTSPLTLHYHRIHNLTFHYNIDTSEHHQKLS